MSGWAPPRELFRRPLSPPAPPSTGGKLASDEWIGWRTKQFVGTPGNLAKDYGVSVLRVPEEERPQGYWDCLGVHHLTPDENNGQRRVFVEVLGADWERAAATVAWASENQYGDARMGMMRTCMRPAAAAAVIWPDERTVVSVWMNGGLSDMVRYLHANHPDDGLGNERGFQSFFVVFVWRDPT